MHIIHARLRKVSQSTVITMHPILLSVSAIYNLQSYNTTDLVKRANQNQGHDLLHSLSIFIHFILYLHLYTS